MRCRTSHQLNEMPILAGRIAVAFDVSDKLAVSLCGSIETERSLNLLVLQVAVNSFGATDNLYAVILGCIIFGQYACVGVRVVAADNNDGLNVQLADNIQALFKLLGCFQFRTSATNHVETAGVAILVNEVGRYFYVIVVYKSARTHKETVKAVIGVQAFHLVEQARNHVVTARCLSAAKYNAHVYFFRRHFVALYELNQGHSVCVGEQFLNLILIVYTLCRSALAHFHCTLKCLWQFGLVRSSRFLQCTFFHSLI